MRRSTNAKVEVILRIARDARQCSWQMKRKHEDIHVEERCPVQHIAKAAGGVASAARSQASHSTHLLFGRRLPPGSSALLDSDMLLEMMTGTCARLTPRL